MAHILVVDDDKHICEFIEDLLSGLGHSISKAYDGTMALESHERQHADLLIADIIMPKKNGIELIKEFKIITPDIKIIAISGQDASYLNYAEYFGAHCCLRKPFSQDEIVCAVKRLV